MYRSLYDNQNPYTCDPETLLAMEAVDLDPREIRQEIQDIDQSIVQPRDTPFPVGYPRRPRRPVDVEFMGPMWREFCAISRYVRWKARRQQQQS